jgi:hypothetical protein
MSDDTYTSYQPPASPWTPRPAFVSDAEESAPTVEDAIVDEAPLVPVSLYRDTPEGTDGPEEAPSPKARRARPARAKTTRASAAKPADMVLIRKAITRYDAVRALDETGGDGLRIAALLTDAPADVKKVVEASFERRVPPTLAHDLRTLIDSDAPMDTMLTAGGLAEEGKLQRIFDLLMLVAGKKTKTLPTNQVRAVVDTMTALAAPSEDELEAMATQVATVEAALA